MREGTREENIQEPHKIPPQGGDLARKVIKPWSYSAKSLAYPQDSRFGALASLAFLDCWQARSHLTLTKDINLCFQPKVEKIQYKYGNLAFLLH